MEAREYFEKEYGHEHIEIVVEMKDWVSLYGLMDEFAEWKVKNCSIPAVMGELTCDNCGCHPNTIYTTSKGRFCESCKSAS